METIGDRIRHVVAYSGLNRTEFGLAINLSQSMVSKLCNNAAMPSDRTIADICRIFDINEDWMRSGTGKMINYKAKEDSISELLGASVDEADYGFIQIYHKLTESDKNIIRQIAEIMHERY